MQTAQQNQFKQPYWSTISGVTIVQLISSLLNPKEFVRMVDVFTMEMAKATSSRSTPLTIELDDGIKITVTVALIWAEGKGFGFNGVVHNSSRYSGCEVRGYLEGQSGYIQIL